MDTINASKTPAKRRRSFSPEFRAKVVKETQEPGASVAAVALRHTLNANLVHKWRRDLQTNNVAPEAATPEFIALPGTFARTPNAHRDICVELPANNTTVRIYWPCDQSETLARWLKDIIA